MSRMVKCKICGKFIPKEDAYIIQYENKNGKLLNKFYCDSIEYEVYEKEQLEKKQDKENIFNTINELLGYECVNFNIITKEITPLLKVYSYKEILNCFNKQKDTIMELLQYNNIEKEFYKMRYIFTVITNNIADDTKEFNNKINEKPVKKIKSEELDLDDLPFSDYKYIEPKTTDFSDFF